MAYRSMELQSPPQFTFVEKMFISTKWYHRAIGHTYLTGREVIAIVSAFTLLLAIGLGIGGVIFGLAWAAICLVFYLLEHGFIANQVILMLGVPLVFIFSAVHVVSFVRKRVKENNLYMQRSLENKLAVQNERSEDT
jgi:hypothetical protein